MKGSKRHSMFKIISIAILSVFVILISSMSSRWMQSMGDKKKYVKGAGLVLYLKRDIMEYANMNRLESIRNDRELKDKLSRFKERKYGLKNSGRRNILLVQLESMDGYVLKYKYDGEYMMPFLKELSEGGVWYENAYDQTGIGHTSDFEFLISTFNLPVKDTYAYVNYNLRNSTTFQKLIKNYGYESIYVHGGDRAFYNREVQLENMGYDDFVFGDDMEEAEIVGWGASDEHLFDYVFGLMKKYREEDSQKLHYINLATLSNHLPFNYAPKRVIQSPSHIAEDYVNSVRYTDDAIRRLVEKMEEEELMKDWVFVFVSDHDSFVTKKQYEYWGEEEPAADNVLLLLVDGVNIGARKEIVGQGDVPFMIAEISGFDFPRDDTVAGKLYEDPQTGNFGLPTQDSNILNIRDGKVGYVLEKGMDFDINEITKYNMNNQRGE